MTPIDTIVITLLSAGLLLLLTLAALLLAFGVAVFKIVMYTLKQIESEGGSE